MKSQLSKMIETEVLNILDLINPAQTVYKIVNKAKDLSNKVSLDEVIKIGNVSIKILPNFNKFFQRKIKIDIIDIIDN